MTWSLIETERSTSTLYYQWLGQYYLYVWTHTMWVCAWVAKGTWSVHIWINTYTYRDVVWFCFLNNSKTITYILQDYAFSKGVQFTVNPKGILVMHNIYLYIYVHMIVCKYTYRKRHSFIHSSPSIKSWGLVLRFRTVWASQLISPWQLQLGIGTDVVT